MSRRHLPAVIKLVAIWPDLQRQLMASHRTST